MVKFTFSKLKVSLITLTFFLFSFTLNNNQGKNFKSWTWDLVKETASWEARAGLQAVFHKEQFFIMGGRTPLPPFTYNPPVIGASTIHGDVWNSQNQGESWSEILSTENNNQWPARAYFQALTMGNHMYILGGQNFNVIDYIPFVDPFPQSDFFNDVWRSENGVNWEQMAPFTTEDLPNRWSGRAGLSAVAFKGDLYVMGGSSFDDSIIVVGGPPREYYNDVWKSSDNGVSWMKVSIDDDPNRWAPRAGGIAIVKDDYIYMIGGEAGFTCPPPNIICPNPPYFNDVWRTKDGTNWELVVEHAEWAARPGHQVVVSQDRMVLFGGFGLFGNPSDVWISNKGKIWKKVNEAPWNAMGSADIKYDFDAVAVEGKFGQPAAIYSFGGDRETFDFTDVFNYLNVDNDVWKYSIPMKEKKHSFEFMANYPNPFTENTTIPYTIPKKGHVKIVIYNAAYKTIKVLENSQKNEGEHEAEWDGTNKKNHQVSSGYYYCKINYNGSTKFRTIIKD